MSAHGPSQAQEAGRGRRGPRKRRAGLLERIFSDSVVGVGHHGDEHVEEQQHGDAVVENGENSTNHEVLPEQLAAGLE